MTDCQHEWDKISIDGDPSVFSCLHCGQRLETDLLTAAAMRAEQQLGQMNELVPPKSVGSDPESHGSIAWNYESTYYHIYGQNPVVDDVFDPIFIGIPRSQHADIDVQGIVDALNRMVSRRNLGD